jgi:uncharacterized protein with LGFP repeats
MPDVIGAIRDKWLVLGGDRFAQPLDIERPTFDGRGRTQTFSNGVVISWHPEIGAFAVWGLIGVRWQALGREQFGYPLTDELGCPDGRGRFNHFRAMQLTSRPDASIYWTPRTGAHEVYGDIRKAWVAAGYERGPVGYPTSAEHSNGPGSRRQEFEHGFIDWTPSHGARVHGPVLIDNGTALNPVPGD